MSLKNRKELFKKIKNIVDKKIPIEIEGELYNANLVKSLRSFKSGEYYLEYMKGVNGQTRSFVPKLLAFKYKRKEKEHYGGKGVLRRNILIGNSIPSNSRIETVFLFSKPLEWNKDVGSTFLKLIKKESHVVKYGRKNLQVEWD